MSDDIFLPKPVTDGTAAVEHDGFDGRTWKQVYNEYPRMPGAVEKQEGELATAPHLMRDTFWSFYKPQPTVNPVAPLLPSHQVNRQILETLLGTDEFNACREAGGGTVLNSLYSAVATIGLSDALIGQLSQSTKDAVEASERAEQLVQKMLRDANLKNLQAEYADDEYAEELRQEASNLQDQAVEQMVACEQNAPSLSPEEQNNIRAVARPTLQAAKSAIGASQNAAEVLSLGGNGTSTMEGGITGGTSLQEAMALAAQVAKAGPTLEKILERAGRKIKTAMAIQASIIKQNPDERVGFEFGNTLSKVLPTEIALAGHPATRPIFVQRFAERSLMQHKLQARSKLKRGDIYLIRDESSSMTYNDGEPRLWAAAVTMAIQAIAARQKRSIQVISFSSGGRLKSFPFFKGKASPSQLIEVATHFLGGDTEYELWMSHVMNQTKGVTWRDADAILLTDGLADLSAESITGWNNRRKHEGLRVQTVFIGAGEPVAGSVLYQISDSVTSLANVMTDGDNADQALFSI